MDGLSEKEADAIVKALSNNRVMKTVNSHELRLRVEQKRLEKATECDYVAIDKHPTSPMPGALVCLHPGNDWNPEYEGDYIPCGSARTGYCVFGEGLKLGIMASALRKLRTKSKNG